MQASICCAHLEEAEDSSECWYSPSTLFETSSLSLFFSAEYAKLAGLGTHRRPSIFYLLFDIGLLALQTFFKVLEVWTKVFTWQVCWFWLCLPFKLYYWFCCLCAGEVWRKERERGSDVIIIIQRKWFFSKCLFFSMHLYWSVLSGCLHISKGVFTEFWVFR